MRNIFVIFGLMTLTAILFVFGCGDEPGPKPVSNTDIKETPETPTKEPAGEPAKTGDKKTENEGDKVAQEPEKDPAPVDEGPIPFDRMWPDHPLAKELLPDPHGEKTYSYWKNAKVGDWLRFLTHQQQIALVTVVEREGDALKVDFRHFDLKGNEEKKEKPDTRPYNVKEDDEIMKSSLLNNPYVTRSITKWKMFNSDQTLNCEIRFVDNPTGEKNENIYSWDVRCGGFVKMRRGNFTYITLVDYGDAENPPDWEKLKPQDLLNYWYLNNRFENQPIITQADPPEGEMPEAPENSAPPELAEKLKNFETIIGSELSKALADKNFADAANTFSKIGDALKATMDYAKANNFKPAFAEVEKIEKKAAELSEAFKEENLEKASEALDELQELAVRLYVSVNYSPEKKQ